MLTIDNEKFTIAADNVNDRLYYYSDNWQVLEEYTVAAVPARKAYYVWGNYIDELVFIWNGDNQLAAHALQDHLFSTVALINVTDGTVLERCEYDAYGKPTVYTNMNDWQTGTPPTTQNYSEYGNPYLFTGRRLDKLDSGSFTTYYYRNRYYDADTGRFLQKDRLDYVDGLNLYEYVSSAPVVGLDFLGLAGYKLGDYEYDPTPYYDKGAGKHGSVTATKKHRRAHTNWEWIAVFAMTFGLDDAGEHMAHYLDNSGNKYTIDYDGLIDETDGGKVARDKELNLAMSFVESSVSDNGKFYDISSYSATGGKVPKTDDWNWFYAVHGYSTWGKGKAKKCGKKHEMRITLKFGDKYNWDAHKHVIILGKKVGDATLGELHLAGLAKEFEMDGAVGYTVEWKTGQRVASGAKVKKGSGR